MKIVFFGTPSFAAQLLQDLINKGCDIVGVVTRPDKPQGRSQKLMPPEVKIVQQEKLAHIPLFQPVKASDPQFLHQLKELNADLFLVVAYGQILKQELLDIPIKGCINIHASLLPKLRGAAPIQRSIINGDKETGITIMQMEAGLDSGPILYQMKMPITSEMNAEELRSKLCDLSKKALFYVLEQFDTIEPQKQDESLVTFAPKIEEKDLVLNFSKSAQELHDQIRGVFQDGGACCILKIRGQEKRFKIYKSEVIEQEGFSGEILELGKNGFKVAAGSQALNLQEVQLEGKKIMSGKAFAMGYKKEDLALS